MTNHIPTPPDARTVIVGVDTHKHVHVAVAIDSWGIRLRDHAFVADSGGDQALITWAETHGRIDAFGIEGTGNYGASLARAVRRAGHRVVEVNRGDRRTRRAVGKSDTIDAEVAARSVLTGQSTAIPKTADGAVEMMRQLTITRDTAVKARTTAMNTLKQIIVHAPPELRDALHDLTDHGLLTRCAGLRFDHRPAPPQSRRPPPRQRRPLSRRHRPHAIPPAHPRRRRPTHRPMAEPNARSSGASNASLRERSTNASWTDFRARQEIIQAA